MVIPYLMAKFHSVTISIVIWGPITKFNHHQYFQLYGMCF